MTAYLLSVLQYIFLFQSFRRKYRGDDDEHSFGWVSMILVLLVIAFFMYIAIKPRKNTLATAHWFHQFDDLQMSSRDFYTGLAAAIKKAEVPDLLITSIDYHEGGVMSSKREYLRVHRKDVVYDICACPFGRGYFISWWRGYPEHSGRDMVSSIPFIGNFLERLFFPITYYQVDSERMFNGFIHSHVLTAVDALIQQKGLRTLTEAERTFIEPRRL